MKSQGSPCYKLCARCHLSAAGRLNESVYMVKANRRVLESVKWSAHGQGKQAGACTLDGMLRCVKSIVALPNGGGTHSCTGIMFKHIDVPKLRNRCKDLTHSEQMESA